MSKPKIFGHCPAGCEYETVHKEDFERCAAWAPFDYDNANYSYTLNAGETYAIEKQGTNPEAWGFSIQVRFEGEGSRDVRNIPLPACYACEDILTFRFLHGVFGPSGPEVVVEFNGVRETINMARDILDVKEAAWVVTRVSCSAANGTVWKYNRAATLTAEKLFIRFSANADGTDFKSTWAEGRNYIGVATGQTAPTDKSGYTWAEFVVNRGDAESEQYKRDTYGYYYSYIDTTNKKIYLTTNRVVPEIGTANRTVSSFATPAYPVGGKLCLVNGNKYDWGSLGSATIAAIHNNVIEYEGDLGFDTISVPSEFSMDSCTLFVIEAPDVGAVKVREGGMNFGDAATRAFGHNAVAEGMGTLAVGNYGHAEGRETRAHYAAHAEGRLTVASGENSHAEGREAVASNIGSHAEGLKSVASGMASHAEGRSTQAIGDHSHTEGYGTEAHGDRSHAEGHQTRAKGYASHAEGSATVVEDDAFGAHAEGRGTVATGQFSHIQGKWNERDDAKRYAHIVGWGTADADRKNIHTVDTSGNAWFSGDVFAGGSSQDDGKRLLTEDDLATINQKLAEICEKLGIV